ncbi:MAG: hypothetical protein GDA67_01720 [Nitrospira sp. CR1.3]|nr:hypothetical protein [Nitrospira sp. CR1.3]
MKAGDLIEALERFFLDVIGTILPGLAMIVGICYVTEKPFVSFSQTLLNRTSEYEWVLLIGCSYILGHGVTSLGNLIRKLVEIVYHSKVVRKHKERLLPFVMPEKELSDKLEQDPIFKAFLASLLKRIPSVAADANQVTNFRTWRSLALSIAQEHSHIVYRFTFLSLLNLGIATVLISINIAWIGLRLAKGLGASVEVIGFNFLLPIMFIASALFLERFYYFSRIAFQLPFSMAVAKLDLATPQGSSKPASDVKGPASTPLTTGQRLKVYLAGGFQSGWQETVKRSVPSLDYFDPRLHGLKAKAEYSAWDLEAVRRSDCIFAYLEATNPGGYALSVEVGFAKALGKFVILVEEKSSVDSEGARYLEMLTEAAQVTFKTLQEGINFLEEYRKLA